MLDPNLLLAQQSNPQTTILEPNPAAHLFCMALQP